MAGIGRGVSSPHALSAPRSVEEITKAAQDYDYNAQIPLRYWLRTAAALPQQADIYMREGDEETTYLLLFRHAHLILAHLTAHPDAKDPAIKGQLNKAKEEVDKNLKLLDILKPRINQRYERRAQVLLERTRRQVESSQISNPITPEVMLNQNNKRNSLQHLDGHLHSDLAVKLAQQEIERRADIRSNTQRSGQPKHGDSDDLSQRIQATHSHLGSDQKPLYVDSRPPRSESDRYAEYRYPRVQAQDSRRLVQSQAEDYQQRYSSATLAQSGPPVIPPRPSRNQYTVPAAAQPPPRPEKIQSNPMISMKPAEPKYTFASTASLENGSPLRTFFLPPTLRTTFLRIAHKNTLANLETCAFLAGTLVSNALFVSKLIVPAQVSTSDTCEMTNESQLFDYVDSQDDLMVLGWIHTHPTQTCFMSSRDLHTHAGYQMMLAESIAVVCAPSKGDTMHGGDWGAFRLTDPPGKMAILKCDKPGIFHPHDVENVYTDALRPGHVVEAKGLEFEVVDLR